MDKIKSKFHKVFYVCEDCGKRAHELTFKDKHLDKNGEPIRQRFICVWKEGWCGICKKTGYVIDSKEFFYPNFKLLIDERKKSQATKKVSETSSREKIYGDGGSGGA